jgi:hypothetical protein
MIVRELTGDIYFGQQRGMGVNEQGEREAFNTMRYSESEVRRHRACGLWYCHEAQQEAVFGGQGQCAGNHRVLGKEIMIDVARDYPQVELSHVCRQRRHAAGAQPQAVRRDGDRQYVWRHSVRRSLHAHRFHRHAAVGLAGSEQQGPVRAFATVPHRTSPARIWPIRWPPSCLPP